MGRDGTRLILCWNERWAFLAAGLETLSKQHGAESILWFHCQLPDQPHASGHPSQLVTQLIVYSKMFFLKGIFVSVGSAACSIKLLHR